MANNSRPSSGAGVASGGAEVPVAASDAAALAGGDCSPAASTSAATPVGCSPRSSSVATGPTSSRGRRGARRREVGGPRHALPLGFNHDGGRRCFQTALRVLDAAEEYAAAAAAAPRCRLPRLLCRLHLLRVLLPAAARLARRGFAQPPNEAEADEGDDNDEDRHVALVRAVARWAAAHAILPNYNLSVVGRELEAARLSRLARGRCWTCWTTTTGARRRAPPRAPA